MKAIKFNCKSGKYQKGEIATFSDDKADAYLESPGVDVVDGNRRPVKIATLVRDGIPEGGYPLERILDKDGKDIGYRVPQAAPKAAAAKAKA